MAVFSIDHPASSVDFAIAPALNGIQPSEHSADLRLNTRQFSRDGLRCSAYCLHTSGTVALPTCTPSHFEYPAVAIADSTPVFDAQFHGLHGFHHGTEISYSHRGKPLRLDRSTPG
jgi:hypothetical protein